MSNSPARVFAWATSAVADLARKPHAARSPAVIAALGAICGLAALPASGNGSPWLPAPGSGNLSLSYVYQTADRFYRVTSNRPTPGGGEDLILGTLWLQGSYGVSDAVALDLRLGRAKSEFTTGPGIPATQNSHDGLADISAGVTWRLTDEAMGQMPSVAVRVGAIIDGGYRTGYINSLGDGGSGAEASVIVGRFLGDRFALSGEFGYRARGNDIPDSTFFKAAGGVLLDEGWSLTAAYERIDTGSGLDIGGPGFSPDRFPELREESQTLSAGVSFAPSSQLGLGFVYAAVIDGRNTANSDVYGLSISYSFDTY